MDDPTTIPTWLQTVIASLCTAAITWLLTRRLNRATAGEKEANAARTLATLADDLAKQLATAHGMNEVAKDKIIEQEDGLKRQGRIMEHALQIKAEAATIVEEMSHLSYLADPDEEDSIVARRFRAVKAAAKRIEALQIGEAI